MKEVTDKNFGVIIVFLLPGFVLLWGLSYASPEIANWLANAGTKEEPTIGGFLYATLTSLALGLLISAIRWAFVDHFFYWLVGLVIKFPEIQFSKLKEKDAFTAFQGVVENHYRYYQYYSNTLVALIIGFICYASHAEKGIPSSVWIVIVVMGLTLLVASGDCLKKYHDRASAIAS